MAKVTDMTPGAFRIGRICLSRSPLVLLFLVLGVAGCRNGGGGFPGPLSISISVSPASITVPAGSSTTFAALFVPTSPQGGTLTWSVSPANGGTVTSVGVYTAPGAAGSYVVTATWTPTFSGAGTSITGYATVVVLPPAQLVGELNTNLVQASGGVQVFSVIQNSAVVGQLVPFVTSTDPNGNVQVRSGFSIPVACTPNGNPC
jgi:hypothetical protein